MRCLGVPLMLVGLCAAQFLPMEKGCEEPDIPPHSAYLCQPPLCQGPWENGTFEAGAMLEYFCQWGYVLASLPSLAICHRGEWRVIQDVLCKPQGTPVAPRSSSLTLVNSIPLMAGTLVLLSAVILALTLCFLVVRSVPSPCGGTSQAYETLEDRGFVVEGVDGPGTSPTEDTTLSLPSYEEAVYGHTGAPVPAASRGPIPLILLAQPERSGSSRGPGGSREVEDPPPSYQEAMATENALDRQPAERWLTLSMFPRESELSALASVPELPVPGVCVALVSKGLPPIQQLEAPK
ncbi:PREDICTED: sushi domain-containing protein 6-like [Gekko japonicus]|uniref:Sushi domain-containing protein 6-like n=1 Tax=Gekko japonicus TaxID=146911 RepID=A0ABM1KJ61_GEKJA|nr:PREDICTED: sushi domain-containing protein 6-like [Gekko japonicus]